MPEPVDTAPLSAEHIAPHLATRWLGRALHCFAELESTNTTARELAATGAPHGTAVIADAQTRGRGRLGRSWSSPAGKNLYVSIVLRSGLPVERLGQVSLLAGVAVCDAVRHWCAAEIKWPNDVLVGGRKVAGILAEMEAVGTERVVVLGIGVNLNAELPEFPIELQDKAGSLRVATGAPVDRAVFTVRLFAHLEARYDELVRDGFAALAAAWRERAPLIGRRIRVQEPSGVVEGQVLDLADDGALVLRLADGSDHRVVAGDVTVLGGYGQDQNTTDEHR